MRLSRVGILSWTGAAALVLTVACNSSTPTTPTPPPPPTPPRANAAPVLQSVVASVTTRTEVETDVTVTATVTDAETAVDELGYIWTASVGTVSGTGRSVTWRQAKGAAMTPQMVTISLAVTEPYQTLENNVIVNRQHRVEGAAAPFRVHDSPAEVQAVSMLFLGDFANNNVSPVECVRNFSDSCPGKAAERGDIEGVRRGRLITSSTLTFQSAAFNLGFTTGSASVRCRFESTVIQKIDASDPFSPGDKVVADGVCNLTAIYEQGQWKLCTSSFTGSEVNAFGLDLAAPRRSIASALFGYR